MRSRSRRGVFVFMFMRVFIQIDPVGVNNKYHMPIPTLPPRKPRPVSLEEARRNPDVNNSRISNNINYVISKYGHDNYFLSLTSIAKLGINPQTQHATPLGIYAYPLDDSHILGQLQDNALPFAKDQPHMNIFAPVGNVIELSDDYDWSALYDRSMTYFWQRAKFFPKINEDDKQEIEDTFAEWSSKVEGKVAAGAFWSLTRNLSILLSNGHITVPRDEQGKVNRKDFIKMVINIEFNRKRLAIVWNHLFRTIGVDGFVDHGKGIIHSHEPTQSVFFASSSVRLIERLDNPNSFELDINIKTTKDFAKVLSVAMRNEKSYRVGEKIANLLIGMINNQDVRVRLGGVEIDYNPGFTSVNSYLNRFLLMSKNVLTPYLSDQIGDALVFKLRNEVNDYLMLLGLDDEEKQHFMLNRRTATLVELILACYKDKERALDIIKKVAFQNTISKYFEQFKKEAGL